MNDVFDELSCGSLFLHCQLDATFFLVVHPQKTDEHLGVQHGLPVQDELGGIAQGEKLAEGVEVPHRLSKERWHRLTIYQKPERAADDRANASMPRCVGSERVGSSAFGKVLATWIDLFLYLLQPSRELLHQIYQPLFITLQEAVRNSVCPSFVDGERF